MEQRMVIVKSGTPGTVSVVYPQYGLNRRWMKMGQPMAIPYETVEQCLWENGFRRMIDCGILQIDSMQDKKDLGLESEDAEEPENIIVFSEKDMEMLLTAIPMDIFKKKILAAPKLQVDNLIDYAIENEKVDMQKIAFLKELTNRDILKAISSKIEDAEIDKRIAKEEAKQKRERAARDR